MFPETGRVKKFYYSPARIVECVSEYIFLISKNKQAKKTKAKQVYKQAKETKEKKIISAENRLKKLICDLRPATLLKKRLWHRRFFKFWEDPKITFFTEHHLETASDYF